MRNANLTDANFSLATLNGANLDQAIISGAVFNAGRGTGGITKDQLYSTANYQSKNLRGVYLISHDLTDANLSGQDLTNARVSGSMLTGADFTGANVTGTSFGRGFDRSGTGITVEQLRSTSSYVEKDLHGVGLGGNSLSGLDFSGFNLAKASFSEADLTNVVFTNAVVTGANFGEAIGLNREKFYSTISYQQKDLPGTRLVGLDLRDWDFSGQDLRGGAFINSLLTNTDLSGSDLTDVYFSGAELSETDFSGSNLSRVYLISTDLTSVDLTDATIRQALLQGAKGLTKEHIYSTASYKARDLRWLIAGNVSPDLFRSIDLSEQDLRGANLSMEWMDQQDLTNANFRDANLALASLNRVTLAGADLRGTNLSHTDLANADLATAQFDSTTTYSDRTIWPEGFDPVDAGLTLRMPTAGDIDANGVLDASDLAFLQEASHSHFSRYDPFGAGELVLHYFGRSPLDVNDDGKVDELDHRSWVKDVKRTYFGDANLDGEFNSSDLVQVFAANEYEDESRRNSNWSTGDWNGDWEFDSSDLVIAFQDGGYERGPRTVNAVAVPESNATAWIVILTFPFAFFRRRKRNNHTCFSQVTQTCTPGA